MRSILVGWCLVLAVMCTAQSTKVVFAKPVTLNGYASGVAIEWSTLDEAEVDYYAVVRHTDLGDNIVATLEPRGQKDSTTQYRYIDQSTFTHDLSFSVRVAFLDGTYAESGRLLAQTAHSRRTRILRALDSESLARLRISLDSYTAQEVTLRISTLDGQLLDTYHRTLSAGVNDLEVDYANWPAGYYSIVMTDETSDLQWLVHVDPSVPLATTRRVPVRS